VFLENLNNGIDNFSSDGHLMREVISGTFWALDFKFMWLFSFGFLWLFGSFLLWLFGLLLGLLWVGFLCWKGNILQFEKLTDLIVGKSLSAFFGLLLEWFGLREKVSGWEESVDLIFWHEV
jgi:hypothetical protein